MCDGVQVIGTGASQTLHHFRCELIAILFVDASDSFGAPQPPLHVIFGLVVAVVMNESARVYHSVAEQVPTDRRYGVQTHRPSAGALAKDRDPFGIAAEVVYVVSDPLDGHRLIEQTNIARRFFSARV